MAKIKVRDIVAKRAHEERVKVDAMLEDLDIGRTVSLYPILEAALRRELRDGDGYRVMTLVASRIPAVLAQIEYDKKEAEKTRVGND